MGTSLTVSQLAGKLEQSGAAMKKAESSAIQAAANVLRAGAEATMMSASGGSLRNVKNSRLRVTVRMTGSGTNPEATVSALGGGYAILDNPTKGHLIGVGKSTKKAKGGIGPARPGKIKAGGGKVLRINGRFVTGPVRHPGTSGKHTFNEGTEAATPAAFKVLSEVIQLPIEGVFR